MFRFDLGDEVEDIITRLKGIVVARVEWFNGCRRYVIQPTVLKEGQRAEEASFDDEQLRLTKGGKGKVKPPLKIGAAVMQPTGGPQNDRALRRPTVASR